jgi:transcriptional regulator with XRE-family HTH domain
MTRNNTNSTVIAHRIGKLMKAARKATGLTQMKVASTVGINQPVLSKVENLSLELGVVAWLKACELFKIDPKLPLSEELFEAEVKKFDSASDQRTQVKEIAKEPSPRPSV